MDRHGVKTLLILLLLLTNLFLSALWITREQRTYARQRAMDAELEHVLAGAGLTASRDQMPKQSVNTLQYLRDRHMERTAAEALLGPCQADDLGGGITEYHSERGSARFRALGDFEILLENPLALPQPEEDLYALALEMGLTEPEGARLNPVENGYAFTEQTQTVPLWGGGVRFNLRDGHLTGVEGQWLWGDGFSPEDSVSRTAGWSLLSLAWFLRNAGAENSELLGMELGYRLSAWTPDILRLTPCWRIALTEGKNGERVFFVNAVTGVPEPL